MQDDKDDFLQFCGLQPKQLEAAEAVKNKTYILYGGAAGGGKSYFLRWMAVAILMHYFKHTEKEGIRVGLFCEDYVALRERHLTKVQFEFPDWLGTLNQSNHEFILNEVYGSGVVAFRNLDDPSKYLSSEFAAILVDELTMNDRVVFDFLNMRRRWPGIEDTKFIATTNPGGKGHGWVKKLWIDKDFTDERFNPDDFAFVQAKAIDNKFLPESYEVQLESLPDKMRKAYKDGDWNIFEGQYFTEFSHIRHIIEPFEIPKDWTRFRSIDYGYSPAPVAVYWFAVDYDGYVYVYRELYQTELTYKELAKKIVEMTPEDETIEYTVADTDMFAKTRDTGEYGCDTMAENGVPIISANKDRINGWNLLRQFLKEERIVWFSTCNNAIRTIPTLVHDKNKPEDLQKGGDDHCADSIRYGIMSLPNKPFVKKEEPNPYKEDKDSPWYRKNTKFNYNQLYK